MNNPISPLTAEKVANCLPWAGNAPEIQGRIIIVTHQIPYNITRSEETVRHLPLSPPRSPPKQQGCDEAGVCGTEKLSEESDPIAAAPVSKLARHHRRGQTLRVQFNAAQWNVVERRGHAAMYAGVQGLKADGRSTIHIGWTGPIRAGNQKKVVQPSKLSREDKIKLQELLLEKGDVVPIFLEKDLSHGHYEGYCKEVLWPLFHYIVWDNATDGRAEKEFLKSYEAVNQRFADIVIEQYQPGDFIFINDYHLLLVPNMIREKLPDATIGIFIHATFPSSEIFRCLPSRNKILQGMLAANLIGFQTYSYARHFISSCTRVLGCESTQIGVNYNGQMVSVGVFPIGVDVDRVCQFHQQEGVQPKMDAIRKMHAGKKIVVGRDKLDPTKGVLPKLEAFSYFLENYPEWRNKVVLIQVATPTHGDHAKLETRISELVSQINGKYGSLEFTPVHYYHQEVDRDEYYALLSVADACLITCTRDGMNTTSFEFTICQEKSKSPLILSEFAGAAGSLSASILVNPLDSASVASGLDTALNMSLEDKETRHKQHSDHVKKSDAKFWARSFVKELSDINKRLESQSHVTPSLDVEKLTGKYTAAKKRLMFFDYDGTLTPIVSVPSEAKPADDMISYLQTLCNDPRNVVWVVSGRDQATLDEWLGKRVTNLGLSAEHGCYMKYPSKQEWQSVVDGMDMSWKQDVTEIFDYYTERTQGSFVEHKQSSITWHYRMADGKFGEFQAKECQNHLENAIVSKLPVEILVGKKNLEVRPMSINKGEIVKKILQKHIDCELVICAGDDKTDEDMFSALRESMELAQKGADLFSITVGPPEKKTMANSHVDTSDDIVACLKSLANA